MVRASDFCGSTPRTNPKKPMTVDEIVAVAISAGLVISSVWSPVCPGAGSIRGLDLACRLPESVLQV